MGRYVTDKEEVLGRNYTGKLLKRLNIRTLDKALRVLMVRGVNSDKKLLALMRRTVLDTVGHGPISWAYILKLQAQLGNWLTAHGVAHLEQIQLTTVGRKLAIEILVKEMYNLCMDDHDTVLYLIKEGFTGYDKVSDAELVEELRDQELLIVWNVDVHTIEPDSIYIN